MRSLWTRDGEHSLHVADFGGQGPAVVLVHGLGGSWADWSELGPKLTHLGHIFAPDLPGFGLTPLEGRGASLTEQAGVISRLLDGCAADGPALLVGNSAGALAALLAARVSPERLRGLVLIDAALPRRSWFDVNPMLAAAFTALLIPRLATRYLAGRSARLGAAGMVRDSLVITCAHPERVPARAVAALTEVATHREKLVDPATAYVLTARSVIGLLTRRARVHRLLDAAPSNVLLLHGAADRLIPVVAAQDALTQRPDWHLEILEDHGHLPQLEDAPRCAELITRWLSDVMSARDPAAALDPMAGGGKGGIRTPGGP
ncbi:MAG: alpha/beta fold hydrolase [Candidatus Dormibacteria bacterium]